jgi:hypothetical protein
MLQVSFQSSRVKNDMPTTAIFLQARSSVQCCHGSVAGYRRRHPLWGVRESRRTSKQLLFVIPGSTRSSRPDALARANLHRRDPCVTRHHYTSQRAIVMDISLISWNNDGHVTVHGSAPVVRRYCPKCRLSLRESSATFAERKATVTVRESLHGHWPAALSVSGSARQRSARCEW